MNRALETWTETFYSCLATPLRKETVYDMVKKYISTLKLNDFSELKALWKNEQGFKTELDILSGANEPEFELLSKILGESGFANGLTEINLFGLNLLEFDFNEDNLSTKTLGSNSESLDMQSLDVY
jgi:hypothetical protein